MFKSQAFFYIAGLLAIASCDSGHQNPVSLSLTNPIRAISSDHGAIKLRIQIDNDVVYEADTTNESIQVTFDAPQIGRFNLKLEWIDSGVNDIVLAEYANSYSSLPSEIQTISQSDYITAFDNDLDQVTNLNEFYRDTDPRIPDTLPSMVDIPPNQSTNNCFDIGTLDPVVGNGTTAETEIAERDVCLCYNYQMATNEVTFAQYAAFADETGRDLPIDQDVSPLDWTKYNHPVYNVSTNDARAYATWVNSMSTLDSGKVIRLPTEAEWEFAARAGTTLQSDFYSGDSPPGHENISTSDTRPVGTNPTNANPWGLFDIHGNITELTCSLATNISYADSPSAFECLGEGRVKTRGGNYSRTAREARFNSRLLNAPTDLDTGSVEIGIRLVAGPETPGRCN